MILSKDDFIRIIAQLNEGNALVNRINTAFQESTLNTDFMNAACMAVYHDDLVIHLLELMFDDTDTRWISYFCGELEFGKLYTEGCDKNKGENTQLKTPEDLYNLLIKNIKEKQIQE